MRFGRESFDHQNGRSGVEDVELGQPYPYRSSSTLLARREMARRLSCALNSVHTFNWCQRSPQSRSHASLTSTRRLRARPSLMIAAELSNEACDEAFIVEWQHVRIHHEAADGGECMHHLPPDTFIGEHSRWPRTGWRAWFVQPPQPQEGFDHPGYRRRPSREPPSAAAGTVSRCRLRIDLRRGAHRWALPQKDQIRSNGGRYTFVEGELTDHVGP